MHAQIAQRWEMGVFAAVRSFNSKWAKKKQKKTLLPPPLTRRPSQQQQQKKDNILIRSK